MTIAIHCQTHGCSHRPERCFEWDTPEGRKERAFCDRHADYAARSKNSREISCNASKSGGSE